MRSTKNLRRSAWSWAVVACCALLSASPARADHLPLPQAEQADVNHAIDQGVAFLKKAQLKTGTWVADGANSVGYAALPGLTLLECGVPADEPVVQRAAAFVRSYAQSLQHPTERTYDLALTILFLDRLGERKDEPLIRSMAARLIAGQSQSGGWGYKCPVLSAGETQELFAVLRRIAPGPSPIPLDGGPGQTGSTGGGNPTGQLTGNGSGLTGGNPSSPGGTTTKSPGEITSPGDSLNLSGGSEADKGMLALQGREESIGSRHWAWCIKSEEGSSDASSSDQTKGKPKPAPFVVAKPLPIPADLRQLTILQDFSKLDMQDPKDKGEAVIYSTTDNSNTQFAILALWVAQRHDVPMDRTLRLITFRFQSSQNNDGSWSYPYANGGGLGEGPAMDCVGLLGLAVGHGMAQAGPAAANAAPDPAILNGFAALSRHVGVPAGRTRDLPLVNMYMLWSIERVSVLYGLPTIANKDWYRWGAEVLVANQAQTGNWPADGGYPGQTPMANTCLALLFLRKANLVSDLTAALPFRPEELTKSIDDKAALKDPPTAAPPVEPTPSAPPPAEPPPSNLDVKPTAPVPTAPTAPVASPSLTTSPTRTEPETSGGGQGWLVLILAAVAVVLLAASGVLLFLHFRTKQKVAKVSKQAKGRKPDDKRAGGPAANGTGAKKIPGRKSRLGA